MSKKTRRVSVSLHPQKSGPLSNEEIKAILEKDLTNNPSYGYYKGLSIYEITSKIDWLIINRYLEIEYSGRLPMLIYGPKGWEIEKDTYTDEILSGFDRLINIGINSFNMLYLKDRARDMIMLLLDKIQESRDSKYIPILEAWKKIDYKKVRVRIDSVIRALCK